MQGRAISSISTVLVDDEELARDELSYLLRDYPEIEITGVAANGVEAGTLASAPDLKGIYDLRELNKVLVAAGKPPVSAADLGQE